MIALVGVVDAFFIGMLGTEALAAFGLCYPAVMVLQALMFGLANGITASVARARGQRGGGLGPQDRLRVSVAVRMAVALAMFLAALGAIVGPPAFHHATSESIAKLATAYYLPFLLSMVLLSVPMSLTACMRGFGETRSSATVMTLASVLNAGLDPVFMFGYGPIPAYGMAGASISTVAAYVVSMVYASVLMRRTMKGAARGAPRGLRTRTVVREVAAIGGPAMLAQALGPVGASVVTALATGFGPTALAGLGIVQRIDLLVVIVPVATGAGAMPLVGHLAGAGNRPRAAEALQLARRSMVLWAVLIGGLLNVVAAPLAGMFTQQGSVAEIVQLALIFAPISYIGAGLNITTMSCFNAAGHPPLATKLSAMYSVLLLPLGCLVGSQWFGLPGLFGGSACASAIAATIGTRWMRHADLLPSARVEQPAE